MMKMVLMMMSLIFISENLENKGNFLHVVESEARVVRLQCPHF